MLSRTSISLFRRHSIAASRNGVSASFTTIADVMFTASHANDVSCYNKIDFKILENKTAFDAVQKFAELNVGCLIVVNDEGKMTGVVSERDYINKIALLNKNSEETQISEFATHGSGKIITATRNESIQSCMEKMLSGGIRHLPIVEENCDDDAIGLISIKDLVKVAMKEKEYTIQVLSDFALGQGCHFGSD